MPYVLDHVLVVMITILLPLHDLLFWFPRLLHAPPHEAGRARIHAYTESTWVEWSMVAATAALWLHYQRGWGDLGLAAPHGWRFWLGAGIASAFVVFITIQRRAVSREDDPEVIASVRRQLQGLQPLLPHTSREMFHFGIVSVTAGICEEILYRGFLIWYLALLIPLAPAVVVSSLLFGFAHAYQGTKGVLQTGLVGLGLGILYVLSGSLWAPMAVHALVDLNSGLLAYNFLQRADDETWT